jgi:hypothetical protein
VMESRDWRLEISPTVSEKTTGGTDKAYALQKMLHQTPTRYLNVP